MTPKPLQLYRRRWTLVFSLPFTAFFVLVGAYSLFLLLNAPDRLIALFAGCALFVAFCVAGTMGKTVLQALLNKDPAVVIDSQGLWDMREDSRLPWQEIGKLKLDGDEQRILVSLDTRASQRQTSQIRRLLSGADVTIALGGLSYDHRELEKSLLDHHRHGRVRGTSDTGVSNT
jgi:hypothetical protein